MCNYIRTYFYDKYIYTYLFNITTNFVGCKQGGRTQNVNYSFDPLGKNPRGTAICMLDPSQVQSKHRNRYILRGGRKSVTDTSPRTLPPCTPLPVLYGYGGEGKNV